MPSLKLRLKWKEHRKQTKQKRYAYRMRETIQLLLYHLTVWGSGNDELGKVLIKGFIFAVTQLDTLPKTMLFYNGGATLTTEDSDSLEDLKSLEAQGVEIMTCGTCLDYYGLKDKLAVGTVTNMYSIVETMAKAGRIVRPS